MSKLGRKYWVIPGGHIPEETTGNEPCFTSRDQLAILNIYPKDADLKLTIYFSRDAPAGPYEIKVLARRVRKVRFNDLIEPRALPLGEDYACVIESNQPVVVQFSRVNSGQAKLATLSTIAFPGEE